jgi:hypothetical protein
MPFQPGQSGNPSGGRAGSRHRQQLNGEFIAALLRDFRHGGPAAIAKVRKNQPAAYCKLLTLLCPRDVKVEHSAGLKALSDEQLEQAIEALQAMLEQQAKVIEGATVALPAPDVIPDGQPKRLNKVMDAAETAAGPWGRMPRKLPPPSGV